MQEDSLAFSPGMATINVSASTTTASASLTTRPASERRAQAQSIRVVNLTSATAYWRSGVGAQTAVTTDTAIPTGGVEVFRIPYSHDTVAVILSSGTGTVQFQQGAGL